jgi:hypothetical protein
MTNTNDSILKARLELSLFILRLGVFIVMIAWALDKVFSPDYTARIFEEFFFISGLGSTEMMIIGSVEIIILLAFMAGLWKRFTYGFVMLIHAVSTLAGWEKYTTDIGATYSQLYYAAWPMLAAIITLYVLRDLDVIFTVPNFLKQ